MNLIITVALEGPEHSLLDDWQDPNASFISGLSPDPVHNAIVNYARNFQSDIEVQLEENGPKGWKVVKVLAVKG